MEATDSDCERNLVAALEMACQRARKLIAQPGGLPEEEIRKLGRPEGELEDLTDSAIDWWELSKELIRAVGLEDLLSRLVEKLEEGSLMEITTRDPDPEMRVDFLWGFVLVPILKRYCVERPDWQWDAALARELIAEWNEEQMSRADGNFRTISPLRHFEGPGDVVTLDDDLVIRPFTDQDREELWHAYEDDSLSAMALDDWSHVVDYRWQRPADSPFGHQIGIDGVRDVVRALRIHHAGVVESTIVWSRVDPPTEPLASPCHQAFLSTPNDVHYHSEITQEYSDEIIGHERPPRTQIDSGDGEAITELLQGMRAGRDDRRLTLALRRFESAYSRYEHEDSLIDLWIAFEALLLPDGKSKLSYRAAHRIALLAENESTERRKAFEQARLSYRYRSQVVHGEAAPDRLDEVFEQTRELTRKVLRAWILNPPQGGVAEIDRFDLLGKSEDNEGRNR